MWTCKRVAKSLAETHYKGLPGRKRLGLKAHMALCLVCSRYHKDAMLMQDCAKALAEREQAGNCQLPARLPEDAKERMKRQLRDVD
ncbi:MAG TPA: hypothetical protein DCR55_09810 [Lentisphaeria bacterium]|nr:hypothetical protein [Lentisphaeria bacterium]